MTITNSVTGQTRTSAALPPIGSFLYKTIAIYPNFSDVGIAIASLKKNGFTVDQLSLLGREQEHWQENLNLEWETLNTAKGALGGAALGSIPGLMLIAGMAVTGGAGLLVAGPLAVAMASLGGGALGGGLMGAVASYFDNGQEPINVGEKVEDAIRHGQWVIVAHSHDHAEAMIAEKLLQNSRTVHENGMSDET